MMLNIGAGGDLLPGYDNLDKYTGWGATYFDFDKELLSRYGDSSIDKIVCHNCLNEFVTDVVTAMNEFWRVLRNGGILDITVAVVDNGSGAFRDPLARRYLSSEWIKYFAGDDAGRLTGGRGFGFVGKFNLARNEVRGELQIIVLEAIK